MKKSLIALTLITGGILLSACQKKICDMTKEEAKEWTKNATVAEMNEKVAKLTSAEKEKLVRNWLTLNLPEEDKEAVIKGCAAIIEHPKLLSISTKPAAAPGQPATTSPCLRASSPKRIPNPSATR